VNNFTPPPWRITDEQKSRFATILQNVPKGTVSVGRWMNAAPPSADIINDVKEMIRHAGYSIEDGGMTMWSSDPPTGFVIQIKDGTNHPLFTKAMIDAFTAIGCKCEVDGEPSFNSNQIRIQIGRQPL